MRIPSEDEIEKYTKDQLVEVACQYTNLFSSSLEVIKRLEVNLQKLTSELGSKNQQVLKSMENLQNMRALIFGDSSEKRPRTEGSGEDKPKKEKKKREDFGRIEQLDLPKQEVHHLIQDAHKLKDKETGENFEKWEGQFEVSELISIIPMKFILQIHKRQKYKTKSGKIITAPGPLRLMEKSRYSIEVGIDIGISKYQHHIPLERYSKMSKQSGLEIGSNTLYDQVDCIAWYFKSAIYERLKEEVLSSKVKLVDESSWKNLGKKDKEKNKRFFLWGLRNQRAVYFKIFDSRSGEAAEELLDGVSGFLVCDGYTVYKQVSKIMTDLVLCNCWAHVRRKFVRAESFSFEKANWYVKKIGELYDIEEEIKNLSPEEILKTRQEKSKPITDEIYWKLVADGNVLPGSSLGNAINYTLKLWEGLTVFLDHPGVPIDNNAMERTIRGPVVGRKNHYGSKNLKTAETAAIWYSVIETCKECGIDPKFYITRALTDILTKKIPPMPWEISLSNQEEPLSQVS